MLGVIFFILLLVILVAVRIGLCRHKKKKIWYTPMLKASTGLACMNHPANKGFKW